MRSLSNLKVSTKLTGASIIIIALVAAIVGSQVWGSAEVETATGNVVRRAALARAILKAKAGVEGMQAGAFRVRLTRDSKELCGRPGPGLRQHQGCDRRDRRRAQPVEPQDHAGDVERLQAEDRRIQ